MSLHADESEALALITPDRVAPSGGTFLDGLEARHLRWGEGDVRALDVSACPELVTLDLRSIPQGVCLSVAECPRLRRVRLPPAGANIVHWDFTGAVAVAAELEGPVEHFDARRDPVRGVDSTRSVAVPFKASLPQAGDGAGPWHSVQVTGDAERAAATEAEGLLWLATGALPVDWRPTSGSRLRSAWIAGAGVRSVHVGTPYLRALEIEDTPALEEVSSRYPLTRLTVRRAPKLSALRGGGYGLRLHGAGAGSIDCDGAWDEVNLRRAGLAESSVRKLGNVRASEPGAAVQALVRARLRRAREGARGVLLRPHEVPLVESLALGGDPRARALLLRWARGAARKHAVRALESLARLSRRWRGRREVWAARCALYQRRRSAQRASDGDVWAWSLPADLREEGRRADFIVLARCRHFAEAAPLDAYLRTSTHPRDLCALARIALDETLPNNIRHYAERLLRAVLGGAGERPGAERRAWWLDDVSEGFDEVVRWLVVRGEPRSADGFVAGVLPRLRPERRLAGLRELVLAGHAASRTQAMQLAHARARVRRMPGTPPGAGPSEQRARWTQQAMATALLPARTQRLAREAS